MIWQKQKPELQGEGLIDFPNWNNKENDDLNVIKLITWINEMNKYNLELYYYIPFDQFWGEDCGFFIFNL